MWTRLYVIYPRGKELSGEIMYNNDEVLTKFKEIVSKWNHEEKIKILKQYGNARGIAKMSKLRLNEKVAKILVINLNEKDTEKILNME